MARRRRAGSPRCGGRPRGRAGRPRGACPPAAPRSGPARARPPRRGPRRSRPARGPAPPRPRERPLARDISTSPDWAAASVRSSSASWARRSWPLVRISSHATTATTSTTATTTTIMATVSDMCFLPSPPRLRPRYPDLARRGRSEREQRRHPAAGRARAGLERPAQLGGPLAHRRQARRPGATRRCGRGRSPRGAARPRPARSRTDADALVLCRATLVRASVTMRYAATSTAAGRSGNSSGAVTSTATGSPSRLRSPTACCRSAGHQAELVERRRPHRVDHPPDLLDRRSPCRRAAGPPSPRRRPGRCGSGCAPRRR